MKTGVAAHLIVGRRPEPFLPALLESLVPVADAVLVNDNGNGANDGALNGCAFARRGTLVVDRSPFVNFADARNRVLQLHREHGRWPWAAFVDADDVHRPRAARVVARLPAVAADVATIDGFTRHYFAGFRWYLAIDRRMSFFRVHDDLAWHGAVHETLQNKRGRSIVVPYVYDTYGSALGLHAHAAKGRLYSQLGAAGPTLSEADEPATSPDAFFAEHYARAMPYRAPHTAAVAPVRAQLERDEAAWFAAAARAIEALPVRARAWNALRAAGYAYKWRSRYLVPEAAALGR